MPVMEHGQCCDCSVACGDVEAEMACWRAEEVLEGLDLGVSRMKCKLINK